MNGKRTLVITIALLVLLVTSGWAATLEVTQPVQVTSDSYYERGQAIVYDGTNYWLFYGRSAGCTDPYDLGDPDVHDYEVYYKKAASVSGLVAASAIKISATHNAASYLGETGAAYFGSDVWAFATIDGDGVYTPGPDCDLYGWWSNDGGTTWTEVGPIIAGIGDGQAHHDEIAFGGQLWVLEGASNFTTMYSATPKAGGWSTPVTVGSGTGGLAHFFIEGTDLYIGCFSAHVSYIYHWNGTGWDLVDTVANPRAYDSTLFKVGSDYIFAEAPLPSDWSTQWIDMRASTSLTNLLSGTPSTSVTEAACGANTWYDMWPIGFTDAGGTSYLFYTSERATPSAEGPGNIWYLEVDWTVSNDHYTYVQEAVDAATAGDVVSVAPGLYEEAIVVDKSLSLLGATSGVDKNSFALPATLGDYDTAVQSVIKAPAAGNPNTVRIESSDVTVQGFVIEALDRSVTGGNDYNNLIYIYPGSNEEAITGLTIKNNVIGPNTDTATQSNGRHGVRFNAGYGNTISALVTGNKIFGTYGNGNNVFIWGTAYGTTGIPPAAGAHPAADLSGTVIENNHICYSARSGVELSGAQGGLTIHNNRIYGNGAGHSGDADLKWGSGIMFVRDFVDVIHGSDPGIGAAAGFIDGVTISDNDIYDNTKNGFYFGPMNKNHTVTGNNIHDNGWDGFRVDLEGWYYSSSYFGGAYANAQYGSTSNIELGYGAIHGNTDDAAIVVGTPTNGFVLDASANWWGSADAATVAGVVSGNVDYTPWLAIGTDTGDPGFQGDLSELYVDDDSPQTGTATRLQEGHDLASGSTVNVADGTYGADPATGKAVYITKDNFNLIGQSEAGTIIDGAVGGVGSSGSYWPKGIHVQANNVTVQNLTVTGFTGDLSSTGGYGVLHRDYAHDTPGEGYIFYNGCALDNVTVQDCYSAVYALCFTHLTVSDCIVTDNYSDGMFIARGCDNADVHGNVVTNSGDHGIWVGKCWSGLDPSDNVTISNNTVDGAREGGITFCGSDGATIEGNVITNVAGEVYGLGGLSLTGGASNVTARYNLIYGNDGTWNGYTGTGHGIGIDGTPSNITLNWNSVYGNAGDGCHNFSTVNVDATHNWWGDATGPFHATTNPSGAGDAVSDYVLYDPWIGKTGSENVVCNPDPDYVSIADQEATIDVDYLGGGGGLMYGYTVKVSWDGALVTTTTGDVTQRTLLNSVSSTFWDVRSTGTDEITVTCILLGAIDGVTGPGTMFSVDFDAVVPVGYGVSPVDITIDRIRDKDNNTLSGFFEDDGEIIVDTTAPSVTNVLIANTTLVTDDYIKHGDGAQVTATVTDAHPTFALADIEANLLGLGGASDANPNTYSGGVATWTLASVTCTPTDAPVTVTVTATDAHLNTASAFDTIIADNTAPTAVTGFDAAPGNQQCDLSWTSGTDTYLEGVVVQRDAVGSEYPQYPWFVTNWPAVDTAYPGSELLGTNVYNGTGTSHTDVVVDRNIYYYQAFCYDRALNYGPAVSTARDLATNYWLGDISDGFGSGWGYDGVVDDGDILMLSGVYGNLNPVTVPGDAECDVGPTVHPDWHRLGLPLPDDKVEFEDAMVFAMNYGVVTARVVPFLPEEYSTDVLALTLSEREMVGSELEIALRLEGNVDEVKGVSAAIAYGTDDLEFVSARLSDDMSLPLADVFFWSGTDGSRVLVDALVLGTDVTIGGSGDVAVLTFRVVGDGYSLEVESARIRNADNVELDARLGDIESGGEMPLVFRLVQNSPNPFNPVTKVAYHVPNESEVTIRVYDVSGRAVRTLVDGVVEAGRHVAVWNGRNDAGESVGSGIYFCTMEAPDFHDSRKMTLLK